MSDRVACCASVFLPSLSSLQVEKVIDGAPACPSASEPARRRRSVHSAPPCAPVTGINVQAVSTLSGRLADVGEPCPGSRHDSRAFAESGIAERWKAHYTLDGLGMLGDRGYVGTGVTTPTRKPIGRDLTDVQRACNAAINRLRAAVERATAHVKSWKILKTGFRRSLDEFPAVLLTVAKLEVFRVYGLF
jgi:hypothetical protein